MKYFKQLPTIEYVYEGETYFIKNIFLKIGFINLYKQENPEFFDKYFIHENDRPETIAYKYYGNQDLWWLIIILNDIKDPFFDWCLSGIELEEWSKYEAILEAGSNDYDEIRRCEILSDMRVENEKKREIYLLKPEYVNNLLVQLARNMRKL